MLTINNRNFCEHCLDELPDGAQCQKAHPPQEKLPMALPTGAILLGKYVVACVLGKGGFGITYLAYDAKNDRKVAIKEYFPNSLAFREGTRASSVSVSSSERELYSNGAEKFYKEAELVSQFNREPNIVSVYEFFYENNTAYYAMEYLDGCDLKKYVSLKGGRLGENEALAIARLTCEALATIHAAGVLHRDISPDNIYICRDGQVKLIDFGASRRVLSEQSQSLSIILKHSFAPLEQYQKNGRQGPWTDIYAMGATMYYCVTGQLMDDATTRLADPILRFPSDVQVSSRFAGLISAMTEIETGKRPQNAVQLRDMLSALAAGEPAGYRPHNARAAAPEAGAAGSREAASSFSGGLAAPADKPQNKLALILGMCAASLVLIIGVIMIIGFTVNRPDAVNGYGESNYYDEATEWNGGAEDGAANEDARGGDATTQTPVVSYADMPSSEWYANLVVSERTGDYETDVFEIKQGSQIVFNYEIFNRSENSSLKIGIDYVIELPHSEWESEEDYMIYGTLNSEYSHGTSGYIGWYNSDDSESCYDGPTGTIWLSLYVGGTDSLIATTYVDVT